MRRESGRRVAILGAGFIGANVGAWLTRRGHHVRFVDADVRDEDEVRRLVAWSTPDVVMNCAAKTDIDWCERHRAEALAVNAEGAGRVARAAAASGAALIHVSSGCIYSSRGAAPVREHDAPSPRCHYTWTKVRGEEEVQNVTATCGLPTLVIRPRLVVSAAPSPRNTLVKLLTYRNFTDVPSSCTVLEDLAVVLDAMIAREVRGVFNVVNPGTTSPYRMATILGVPRTLISSEQLDRMTLAKRVDAVLSTEKLDGLGLRLESIEARLPSLARSLHEALRSPAGAEALRRAAADTSRKLAWGKASSQDGLGRASGSSSTPTPTGAEPVRSVQGYGQ